MKKINFIILYIIGIVILSGLSIYSYIYHINYAPSVYDLLENKDKYNGFKTEYVGTIINKTNDYFYLKSENTEIKVLYSNVREPKFGQIRVYGIFEKEGYIRALDVQYHDYNFLKYILSLAGFVWFIIIFFREWKITKRGFENA